MVLDVALVPSVALLAAALASPLQAPSRAPPRPDLPPLDRPPAARSAGLARRIRCRHVYLARDDATTPALNGLAAGAAFGLWCAGGGANTACASTGCVEKGVHLQVYGSGTRNKSSGLIRGFSRAKRHATRYGRRGGEERPPLLFFRASATGVGGGWWSRRHEIGKPSLFPPPLHTVPTASTYMAVCSPPNAPPRGAPKRAQGIWIAQMVLFPGRRRHVGGAKRRR